MNTASIIKLICWTLIALMLIAVLVIGIWFGGLNAVQNIFHGKLTFTGGSNGADDANEYSALSEYSVDAGDITSLSIDWVDGNVELLTGGTDQIFFSESAAFGVIDQDTALRYSVSGGTLSIRYCENSLTTFSNVKGKTLTLYLPEALAANLDKIKIASASAEISVCPLTAQTADFTTVSGCITLSSVTADSIDIDTTSGAVKCDGCSCREFSADTVSGEVTYGGAVKYAEFDTVSGNIVLAVYACPERLDVDGISANVRITLPNNNGFTVDVSSVSGDLSSEFPMTFNGGNAIFGDGSAQFSISSVSGNVSILSQD